MTRLLDPALVDSLRAATSATPRALGAELQRFENLVEITDLDMAMVRARRALEMALRSAFSVFVTEPGTRPLDALLAELGKASKLPSVVEKHCRVVQTFGNLGAHGADPIPDEGDVVALSSVEAELCSRSLNVIAQWYVRSVLPRVVEQFSFRVLLPGQIGLAELEQAAAIDVHVYPEGFRGKPDVLLGWHTHNPEIFTIVADVATGRVVGCLTVIPLDDATFSRLESGSLIDVDLPVAAIRRYDLPDFYKLYVASVVVDPAYQGSAAFGALYEAHLDRLLSLARREVFATELLADVITADGERLAQFIGMQRVRPSDHGSGIYKAQLLPPALRVTTRKGKQLLAFYASKYQEFKDLLDVAPPIGSGDVGTEHPRDADPDTGTPR
jgi:hypothetical protein